MLDGFHDFLKPTSLHELQNTAKNGPIVMLNASKSRCDALIVTSVAVDHIPFPKLDASTVDVLTRLTRSAQANRWDSRLSHSDQTSLQILIERNKLYGDVRLHACLVPHSFSRVEDILPTVLESLWVDVVQLVVSHLKFTVSRRMHYGAPLKLT